MLLESSVKGIGKAVRATLLKGYDELRSPAQGGSCPRITLQMPMLHVQEFLRRLNARRISGGLIFIDGRNAFYSTLRELLFDVSDSSAEDALLQLVHVLSPDEAERDSLLADLLGPGLLQQAGIPEPLRNMLHASMHRTWFCMDSRVYSTTTGTMPGAPLADLLFEVVFTRFISRVRREISEHALGNDVFEDGSMMHLLPLPSWMDDIAMPLVTKEAVTLVDTARRVVEATARHLHAIGISINTDKGKTEAMLCFQGKGSRSVRHHHLVECRSCFTVCLPRGVEAQIHITPTYVHLGANVSWNASPIPDIRRRAGMTWEAVAGVRRHILANPGLTWSEKMHMYSSLIMSRFLHGAGLWVLCTKESTRAYCAAYVGFLRKACWPVIGCSSQSLTDQQVCAALGQFDPHVQRRFDVLGQLAWVARHRCQFFRRLLIEGEWLQCAIEAWHALPSLQLDLPREAAAFIDAICDRPADVARAISSLKRACRKQCLAAQPLAAAHARFYSLGHNHGWLYGTHETEERAETPFQCNVCGLSCGSKSSLASHKSRRHGQRAVATQCASGTTCFACRSEYWDTKRLRMHLRKNPGCARVFESSDVDFLDSDYVAPSELSWLPVTPSCTPQPWWATLRPIHAVSLPSVLPAAVSLDISHEAAELLHCFDQWRPCAKVLRQLISKLANFGGSTEYATVYSRTAGQEMYNCFEAVCAIAHALHCNVQSTGRHGVWTHSVRPPLFCLRRDDFEPLESVPEPFKAVIALLPA